MAGIDATFGGANLWVDYIYLDVDERRRFAQVSHEYLIEQVQFTGDETVAVGTSGQKTSNIRLNFNHPTKYLAWVVSGSAYGQYTALAPVSAVVPATGYNANGAVVSDNLAPLYSAKLQLNGQDRFSARWGLYFNKVQPLQTVASKPAAGVYLYSFALKPQEHQPSGTCNFSRIDNATLNLTFKTASAANTLAGPTSNAVTGSGATALTALRVFAVNYNILRILSGMGGLKNMLGLKSIIEKMMTSEGFSESGATLTNCGEFLTAFTTTCFSKEIQGTRVTTDPNGNNVKDWIIRSQHSFGDSVQRLHVSGWASVLNTACLRYSPFPLKYIERWGEKVHTAIKLCKGKLLFLFFKRHDRMLVIV